MTEALLPILLSEFHDKLKATAEGIVKREASFPDLPDKIKVAIGMRRVGKTYFLLQNIHQLIKEDEISLTQILYLNFEDDRLAPCSQAMLRELVDAFYSLYPENHDRVCYLFFDEIQNVKDWSIFIRRMFDTRKVQIYLTGSSSKLLSKEIHTSLRGRAITTEIWPYSFREYLLAKNIRIDSELFDAKKRDIMNFNLREYIATGGFPEIINKSENDSRQILQGYVDVVVMRDIIERYGITNITLIKYMVKTLIKNTAGNFTVNKFVNDLKSQGFTSSKNTIHDYLSYIEDAYLAFAVSMYSESIRRVHSNPRKLYANDTGLVRSYSFSLPKNDGHLFENLIYLDLRRRGHQVYYYLTEERYEVDFFSIDRAGKPKLYQVVWDMTDKSVIEREERALKAAMSELQIPGEIITAQTYIKNFVSL